MVSNTSSSTATAVDRQSLRALATEKLESLIQKGDLNAIRLALSLPESVKSEGANSDFRRTWPWANGPETILCHGYPICGASIVASPLREINVITMGHQGDTNVQ